MCAASRSLVSEQIGIAGTLAELVKKKLLPCLFPSLSLSINSSL